MNRVYIAGPMTGLPRDNYPAFHAEAKRLRALGYHVENPAENPRQLTWEAYMKHSIRQLLTCDIVAMLPGWHGSQGATEERRIALKVAMDIVDAELITFPPQQTA